MGIDKGLGSRDRIAIIDGMVFQWGNVEYNQGTFEPLNPDDQFWLVEHHSYAKHYLWHGSEQKVRDFIDGLPESKTCSIEHTKEQWRALTHKERRRILEVVRPKAVAKVAAEKRKKLRKKNPEDFVPEVRHAIEAVIRRHIVPYRRWDDPEIGEQIELILTDALRRYKAELHPADPLPTDEPDARLRPAVAEPGSDRSRLLTRIEKLLKQLPTASDEADEGGDKAF